MLLNVYDTERCRWHVLHHPLIGGEGQANAYWWRPAAAADGALHLAWCWRRTGDAATNRDVCYATSRDGGRTWSRSDGSPYRLPITGAQAEVADPVGEGENLMNQCASCVDAAGRPHLVHYRNDAGGIPQIFHVHFDGQTWWQRTVTDRRDPFSLVVVGADGTAYVICRDDAAGGRVGGRGDAAAVVRTPPDALAPRS